MMMMHKVIILNTDYVCVCFALCEHKNGTCGRMPVELRIKYLALVLSLSLVHGFRIRVCISISSAIISNYINIA